MTINIKYFCMIIVFPLLAFTYEKRLMLFKKDFQTSMQRNPLYCSELARNYKNWQFAEDLFNKHVVFNLEYADNPRIPLNLHHVWLGSPLPDYAKEFRKTWIDNHPDWTFILWTDHPSYEYGDVILHSFQELQGYLKRDSHAKFIVMDMHHVKLHNDVVLHQRASNYGEKSDVIRYEALYQVGGLYVDTDFECLKRFDDLHYALDFYLGIAYDPCSSIFTVLNGLMASSPFHPILAETISRLHDKPHIAHNSLAYTGPHFLTEVILDLAPHLTSRIVCFPLTYFYPMPVNTEPVKKRWVEPESYAIHYWKVSWAK